MDQQIPPPNPNGSVPNQSGNGQGNMQGNGQQQNQHVQMNNVQVLGPPPPVPPQLMTFPGANPSMNGSANPLFPPQTMISNPAAFLAMPDMFAAQTMQAPMTNGSTTQPQGVMMQQMPKVMGNQPVAGGYNVIPNNNGKQSAQTSQASSQQQVPNFSSNPTHSQPVMTQNSIGSQMDTNIVKPAPPSALLGGVPIPALPPNSSTAMQVQVAAAAAAAAAAPMRSGGKVNQNDNSDGNHSGGRSKRSNLTAAEKAKQNRDRNREHARSTRLRKKAYVQKLKELVDGLHAERTEEVRKRRVAIQHLAEVQSVRRAVVRTFLRFHSSYESDPRKWTTLFEDDFWLKQPVTPYRSFRRAEIEQECRISRGVDAMISDSASLSVMVEGIGSRSARWMQIKREDALLREEARGSATHMPHSIVRQNSRLQHAVSSLSSSSGSSNGSGGEEDKQHAKRKQLLQTLPSNEKKQKQKEGSGSDGAAPKVSTSGSSSSSGEDQKQKPSNDFHDYHAPALPDPMLDSGGSSPGCDSPPGSNDAVGGTKHVSSDSSSGDEANACPSKRRKVDAKPPAATATDNSGGNVSTPSNTALPPRPGLPANIAKSGGISHNIRPVNNGILTSTARNDNPRLNSAPAVPLPPFVGIGKRPPLPPPTSNAQTTTVGATIIGKSQPGGTTTVVANAAVASTLATGAAVSVSKESEKSNGVSTTMATIAADNDTTSSNSSNQSPQIRAIYHMNEDDMLLTEDVLMCPFIFRSQDAVLCGALAECIMPGMLRANFSPRNKLISLEMVYDAMGFMQQLERASGSEGTAQIVPSSLEMALSPNTNEARVITMAKPPFRIVSVNEAWTRTTKYTQMEVEGKELTILHGKRTDPDACVRSGKPVHKFEEVARGRTACSVNIHYDKKGRDFIDFVCSYPLTNASDDITHILHVFKELPTPSEPTHDFADATSNESESVQNQ
eukprot:CAMPEP_0195286328 /NCGR_PEP_ID=MMETSP0707-20130614/3833_1 /TAXON_ID=33640 /ORGANISM="Asterionellopsis glacialis, Strain CCMP134" /LENGTH=952 /DNA_ID=CAMNT_0040345957 /DNA_START=100 /DNA_END=2958 /DNA_ORIENTATION=-